MADDWNDDWEDPEPDTNDDAEQLVPCASCGEQIYEDAEKCPHCGEYVVASTSAFAGRPLWFCALGLLGVAATIFYFLHR